jgi:hypothetical protein
MLGGHQGQHRQAQLLGQRVEVVLLHQPGREVVGFVLPGFSQGDAFEFAEGFFHFKLLLPYGKTAAHGWVSQGMHDECAVP